MRIGKIAISAEYQMNEQFQNLPIFGAKFWFSKLKKSRNSLTFQFGKFRKYPKFLNFENRQITIIDNS